MPTVPALPARDLKQADPAVAPGSLAAWVLALRLRSLLVAISPVIVAASLVWERTGRLATGTVVLILAASVMLQIITNLQNDVGYTRRGGERGGTRIGLPRATALGVLTIAQVRTAVVFAVALAVLLGLPLVLMRGWVVLAMGIASILAALAYMGGPKPIAYTPFGEVVVFAFFGLIAVVGADYTMTGEAPPAVTWLAAVAMGSLAMAALLVNNHRDIEHDAGVGRRTLPVALGVRVSRALYVLMLSLPFLLAPAMAWQAGSPWLLAPLLALPTALRLLVDFHRCPPGLPFNAVLFRTFKLELVFAALLCAGAIVARALAT
jgi:1,4-dihydroxy-2-naphthoate octaprenyltransferase